MSPPPSRAGRGEENTGVGNVDFVRSFLVVVVSFEGHVPAGRLAFGPLAPDEYDAHLLTTLRHFREWKRRKD